MAPASTGGALLSALALAGCVLLNGCAVRAIPTAEESQHMREAAVLAYESGEDARAETLYQGLARAYPLNPENWLRLGNLYARANRPDDAATAYQKSLQIDPGNALVWYNLGVVRERQAYALFMQANTLAGKDDPVHERSEVKLKHLEPPAPDKPAKVPEAPAQPPAESHATH